MSDPIDEMMKSSLKALGYGMLFCIAAILATLEYFGTINVF
jgi:hypothetical protein